MLCSCALSLGTATPTLWRSSAKQYQNGHAAARRATTMDLIRATASEQSAASSQQRRLRLWEVNQQSTQLAVVKALIEGRSKVGTWPAQICIMRCGGGNLSTLLACSGVHGERSKSIYSQLESQFPNHKCRHSILVQSFVIKSILS